MASVRFTGIDGQEFTVPDRVCGDGPEIEITICKTGEFIDPNAETLRFMPMPPPPVIERLQVGTAAHVARTVDMGADVRHPTEDELHVARSKLTLADLLKGYYG